MASYSPDKDLLREMYSIFPYARQHNGLPKAGEAGIRQGALEMIIFEEMVYQEAQRRKITIPPAKIDKAEAAFKQQFDSPDQFQQYMQQEMNGSRQQLRKSIERSLMIDQLLKQEVDNRSVVTPAEVKAYYDRLGPLPVARVLHLPEHLDRASAEGHARSS